MVKSAKKATVCLLLVTAAFAQRPGVGGRGGGFGTGQGPFGGGQRGGASGPMVGAAPTAEKPPTPTEDLCTISGVVTAADSKEPLKKANLVLTSADRQGPGMQPYSTSTDAEGRYAMKDLEPGRYRFSVARNGYVRQEYGAKRPGRGGTTLTLNKGQQLTEVNFSLMRQSVIAGRVLDEDGEPVSRAFVQAVRYSWVQGRKQLVPQGMDQTDDRGQYRIHDLPAGKYFVSASYSRDMAGWFARDRSAVDVPDESYINTYYPGTTDAATAAQLETGVGTETQGIDIRLQKVSTVRIRGKVVNAVGGRSRRIMVMLMPRGSSWWTPMDRRPVQVDAHGNFEVRGVSPGSYTLSADYFDSGQRASGRMHLDVGRSSIDGIALAINPAAELKGVVKLEEGAKLESDNVRVSLRPRDNPMFFGGMGSGTIKEDGSFTIQGVVNDIFDVVLFGLPAGHYLKAARYGQEEVLASGLNLTQGVAGTLELVISPNAAKADGMVTDEKQQPLGGITVVIAPETPQPGRSDLYKSVTTDQTGHYTIESIPPGKYRLFAFEDLEQGAAQDADYLKDFEQKSEKADLQEKATFTKQLAMIPAEDRAQTK